ncbi:MAG TPA: phage tail protein [Pseudomonas sp.]|uniref:phage tail protein n=1 Tax=Pseudomonas sp. TaxID=306 RepID=UPI002ED78CE0
MSIGSFYKTSSSSGLITIQPSAADLQAFTDFAKLVPKAAANAQRRAINKTLGWLRTHIAREVGRKEGIAMRAVRQRLRAYSVKAGKQQGKLWFGINPLEASRTGRPRQTQSGVSVGHRRYGGAFYKKVYGSKADIWIRTASKHFKASDYPNSEVSGASGPSSGWIAEHDSRFPLAKAKVSLEDVRPLFESWTRRADARLLEILKQELNYELQKYLRGNARG